MDNLEALSSLRSDFKFGIGAHMEVMDVVCTYSRIAFSGERPGRVLSVECVSRHASKVRRVVWLSGSEP